MATVTFGTSKRDMKKKMTETVATPSSSSGAVMVDLDPHVLMALPKKTSWLMALSRWYLPSFSRCTVYIFSS